MIIRKSCVDGLFYPGDKDELKNQLSLFFKPEKTFEVTKEEADTGLKESLPKILIVPHAGYIYSGRVAARAYQTLSRKKGIVKIVLIGPSHRVSIEGMVLSGADFFETPLGKIKISKELTEIASDLDMVSTNPIAHEYEHSLEVQLPFLQYIYGESFEILPVLTNHTPNHQILFFLEKISPITDLIIISTDLSHYLTYDEATAIDAKTCHSIENLELEKLHYEDACGLSGLTGILLFSRKNNLKLKCLYKANSGDETNEKTKVVGYASFTS